MAYGPDNNPAEEDAESIFECAMGLHSGNGVQQDLAKALEPYRMTAERGYAIAEFNLGHCFVNRSGVEHGFLRAFNRSDPLPGMDTSHSSTLSGGTTSTVSRWRSPMRRH